MPDARELLDDEDEDPGVLTPQDLQSLYEITGKIGANGRALDELAALRRKLRGALAAGQEAVFLAHMEQAELAHSPSTETAVVAAEAPAPAAPELEAPAPAQG